MTPIEELIIMTCNLHLAVDWPRNDPYTKEEIETCIGNVREYLKTFQQEVAVSAVEDYKTWQRYTTPTGEILT